MFDRKDRAAAAAPTTLATGLSVAQMDYGRPGPPLVIGGFLVACDVRMSAQKLRDGPTQRPFSMSMYDPHLIRAGQIRDIEELVYPVGSLIYRRSDYIQLG